MTHMYRSTAVPRSVFGEDTPELKQFYISTDELFPGANALNHELAKLWNPEAYAHVWTLPDGFESIIKVMSKEEREFTFLGEKHTLIEKVNKPVDSGRSLPANIIHSIDGYIVREMGRRCNHGEAVARFKALVTSGRKGSESTIRPKDLSLLRALALAESTGVLSAVVFEYIDEDNIGHVYTHGLISELWALAHSLPVEAFPIITIHDDFRASPKYGNNVRKQYALILAELARSNLLSAIVSELVGKTVKVNKLNENLADLILESDYPVS